MREIRSSGKVVGVERIAVMAALNIAYELLQCNRKSTDQGSEVKEHIDSLVERLEGALEKNHELNL